MTLRDNPETLMLDEVRGSRYRQGRAVAQIPNRVVAAITKQCSNSPGDVIVVNMQVPFPRPSSREFTADCTAPVLGLHHGPVFFLAQSILGFETSEVLDRKSVV